MSHKVIALVYPVQNGTPVEDSQNTVKKALGSLRASLANAYDGRACYTSFGDLRGKTPNGDTVTAYAVTMELGEDDETWFYEKFWGMPEETYVEVLPGVGYFNKTPGHAPMHLLDVDDLENGVRVIVDTYGIDFIDASKVPRTKRTKVVKQALPTDPYGTTMQVLALCHGAIPDFDIAAALTLSRPELVKLYEATFTVASDESGEEADAS